MLEKKVSVQLDQNFQPNGPFKDKRPVFQLASLKYRVDQTGPSIGLFGLAKVVVPDQDVVLDFEIDGHLSTHLYRLQNAKVVVRTDVVSGGNNITFALSRLVIGGDADTVYGRVLVFKDDGKVTI